jgi:hypothetical protein
VPCTGLRERLALVNYETFLINSLDMRDCSGSVFLSKLSSCSPALSHTPVCRVLLCYFFSFFCCRCCFPLLLRFVCVCVCFIRFLSYFWEGSSAWCFVLFCVCRVFALFPQLVGKAVVMQIFAIEWRMVQERWHKFVILEVMMMTLRFWGAAEEEGEKQGTLDSLSFVFISSFVSAFFLLREFEGDDGA